MTDKDNIKLKTDTPSPRKSGSSIGVHVKRKRKIIAKPPSSQTPHSSRSTKKEEKKETVKETISQEIKISKVSTPKEVTPLDSKPAKKHKIDKDEKI